MTQKMSFGYLNNKVIVLENSNFIKNDGSIQMKNNYVPVKDLDIATKQYVDILENTILTLQKELENLITRVEQLENASSLPIDLNLELKTSVNTLNLSQQDIKLTNKDVYGPNLDGQNGKVELRFLGYNSNALNLPGELVPRTGVDVFESPTKDGSWSYDEQTNNITFTSGSPYTKIYKLIKK